MEGFVPCRKIAVYFGGKNDDGSPKGFSFYVRAIEATELERFTRETLEIFDIPNDGVDIFASPNLPSKMMRGKDFIKNILKSYKESLDEESKKNGK